MVVIKEAEPIKINFTAPHIFLYYTLYSAVENQVTIAFALHY